MTPLEIAAALVVQCAWGLNFVAAKWGMADFPPLFFLGLRFTLILAVVLPLVGRPAKLLPIAVLSTVFGIFHFGLLFLGVHGANAATAAVVLQVGVPLTVLLGWWRFGEAPDRGAIGGMLLAFGGILLIFSDRLTVPRWAPLSLLLLSGAAWAASNLQVKSLGEASGVRLNAWVAVFAAPQLFLLSALLEHGQTAALLNAGPRAWGALAFTAFGSSLLGHGLWYWLLSRRPVNRVVPYSLLNPVVGVASSVWLLGEPTSWKLFAGGALTLAGMGVLTLRRPPPLVEEI